MTNSVSRNPRRALWTSLLIVLFVTVVGVRVSYEQEAGAQFPESHKMMLGGSSYMAYFGLSSSFVAPSPPGPPGGTGRPPRVGPNTVVNAPQTPFPGGLLGRSETTIASDTSGKFLTSGWNDAEGFCGPPFNAPCNPPPVPGGGDGLIQFWPVVTVQPDGDVVVTYNESLETLGTSLVDVFTATSTDGGVTFGPPLRVTEVTTDWGATATDIIPNFGDYIFTISTGNKDHVTWADGRNGVPDVFYATVKSR